jgi:predicted ATPase
LLAALDDNSPNEFKSTVVKVLTDLNETNFESAVIATPLLRRLFQNMISELDAEKLALGSINLLVEKFNQFLIEGKKLVVTEEKVYVEVDGGQHSIHDLASGERHILTFLSLVLFHGQKRNFLIIDEPEISLNIVWQRELLSLFGELLPSTQIIVASHSPFLAKRSPALLTPLTVGRIK